MDLITFATIADTAKAEPETFEKALADATADLVAELAAEKAKGPRREGSGKDRRGIGSWIGR